jgi:hypothetical protein
VAGWVALGGVMCYALSARCEPEYKHTEHQEKEAVVLWLQTQQLHADSEHIAADQLPPKLYPNTQLCSSVSTSWRRYRVNRDQPPSSWRFGAI